MSTAEKDPAMTGNDEPSMEEILASIRKIIDSDEEPAADGRDAEEPAADGTAESADKGAAAALEGSSEEGSPEAPAEVLELTKAVEDDGSVRDLKTGEITEQTVAVEEILVEAPSTKEAAASGETASDVAEDVQAAPQGDAQDDPLANIDAFADMVDEDNSDAIAALTAEPDDLEAAPEEPIPDEAILADDPFADASTQDTSEESGDAEDDPFAASPEEDSLNTEPVTVEEQGEVVEIDSEPFAADVGEDSGEADMDIDFEEEAAADPIAEEAQDDETPNAALLSKETASAAAEAMASLKASLQASTKISSNPGNTLEDLAASLMKPMLKEWLDENLPPLVERVVKAEIEKLKVDL